MSHAKLGFDSAERVPRFDGATEELDLRHDLVWQVALESVTKSVEPGDPASDISLSVRARGQVGRDVRLLRSLAS
jgi:hypothetical protein